MAAIVQCMRALFLRHNGLLAASLSVILMMGGSIHLVKNTLADPPKQSCIKGIDTAIAMSLGSWFNIKCRKE